MDVPIGWFRAAPAEPGGAMAAEAPARNAADRQRRPSILAPALPALLLLGATVAATADPPASVYQLHVPKVIVTTTPAKAAHMTVASPH